MKLRLLLAILLISLTTTTYAEVRLLASATSDSYQSLTYGLSAFCQAAGFPFALTEINDNASALLLIPNLAGIDVQHRISLCWLASAPNDPQESGVASVAILPTTDHASTALLALTNSYPLRVEEPQSHIWRYTLQPTEPLAPALPEPHVIYAAAHRDLLIVSASRDAVLWAISHPLAPQSNDITTVAGQIRLEFQPAAILAWLPEELAADDDNSHMRELFKRLLGDVRTLALVLEASSEGVTAHLAVTPHPATQLARLFQQIHPPAEAFWPICPDQATVALASGGSSLLRVMDAYITNSASRTHTAEDPLGDCRTGDHVMFISSTSATGALYYAEVIGITNRATAWARACANPQALLPLETSFRFVTNETRTVQGVPVLDLRRSGFTSRTTGRPNPADMAAFMVRDGGISLAATSNKLVMTFGTSNAIEQVLQRLTSPPTHAVPLTTRCRKLLPNLPAPPCFALLLQPAGLIHQIATSLPGLTPEQIAELPQPGDGIAEIATRDAGNTLHLTLRVSATEVAHIKDAMTQGQSALQQLFMQMTLQQMMQMNRQLDAADRRDPSLQLQR